MWLPRELGFNQRSAWFIAHQLWVAMVDKGGVKDRKTGQVNARHVESTDTLDVAGLIAERTMPGAKVYTGEAGVYT